MSTWSAWGMVDERIGWRGLWVGGLVALVVVVVHAQVKDGGFVLDATAIVRDNPRVQHQDYAAIFRTSWWEHASEDTDHTLYRPLTLSWFALLQGEGEDAEAVGMGNLLLHGLVSLLRFLLLAFLFRGLRHGVYLAGAAAVIAGVHGIATESVVGMVGAAELLAALFMTCSWLAFSRGQAGLGPAHGKLWLFAAMPLWFLALLSKE
ncbi:MAG: hypothetical protein KDB53_16690, partial [Planctomycetes bacterium]|nr:hypothetical protein [Planctomycetota bacterium]